MSEYKELLVDGSYKHTLVIPQSWVFAPFKEVIEIVGGSQPPKSEFRSEGGEGLIRLIQIRDYKSDKHKVYIPIEKAKRFVSNDDVMIGRYGPPIFQILRGIEGAYNVALMKAVPKANTLDNDYLFKYLSSYDIYNYVESASDRTAGQSGVNKKHLEQYPVGLPPLAEQEEIARRLDDLLAQVDSIKARLDKVPKTLKSFRQSVLAAAVSGQLTESWRKVKGVAFDTWENMQIGDIAKEEKYSLGIGPFGSNLKVIDYQNEGHPLVFVREIRAECFGGENTKFVNSLKFEELKAHRVSPGNILITKMGDPPGDVTLYPYDRPEAVITSDCIKLAVDEQKSLTNFTLIYMRSDKFRSKVFDIAAGVAQQKVNLKKFRKLTLDIPPLEEQKEIVRRVEELFAYADSVEEKVKTAQECVDKLTQSTLKKAFSGELTAQWRRANPELISGENSAEALLARIQAERAAANPTKKTRKKKA